MQDARVLAHHDLVVADEGAFILCSVLKHGDIALIRYHIPKSQVAPIDVFLFHLVSSRSQLLRPPSGTFVPPRPLIKK